MAYNKLPLPHKDNVLNKFRIWKERHVQMRKPFQSPVRMKNSSYYIVPVGDRTHDLPHTVASNMVKVSHALTHSATAAVLWPCIWIPALKLQHQWHRSQHYRFRAGNLAFRVPPCFATFQLKCPTFLRISHSSCDVSICIILCVLSVWNIKLHLGVHQLSLG